MDVPTGRLAMWWVLASETVIFGGLLGSYVMMRLRHGAWADQAAITNTWAGAFNTLVLLTSSLSAVLAHQAAERGDGPKAARLLRYTILGGGVFLTVKAFEWTHEIAEGFTITSGSGEVATRPSDSSAMPKPMRRASPSPARIREITSASDRAKIGSAASCNTASIASGTVRPGVTTTINAPASALLLLYQLVGEEQGVDPAALTGTTSPAGCTPGAAGAPSPVPKPPAITLMKLRFIARHMM